MASNGGTLTVDGAVDRPTQLLMSGPVAGIVGGIAAARSAGFASVITLDVGGTSADIGVAPDAKVRMKHLYDTNLGGYEVMVPMVDLDTIGAGGGSIARVDAGGLLRVGPQSAGAVPGPGLLRPRRHRAGRHRRAGRARAHAPAGAAGRRPRAAGRAPRARRSSASAASSASTSRGAALGITQILTQNMVNAISVNSVQKGFDPRDFSLVAFGGGGPLYGADIARELSIPRVIVPPHPGITSAMGLLDSDLKYEAQRTVMVDAPDADAAELDASSRSWRPAGARSWTPTTCPTTTALFQRWADCRYVGQAYELLVPVPSGPLDAAAIAELDRGVRGRPRARVLLPLPRQAGADRARALLRDRADAVGRDPRRSRPARAEPAGRRRSSTGGPSSSPTAGEPREYETPFYDRERAARRQRDRGPGDHRAARLDHRRPAGHARHRQPDGAIVIETVTQEARA